MNLAPTFEPERRGSRSRALERSLSYSEAIGNGSGRSSIEIPRMVETDVYNNEELKKHYRISQTYVEGKEIAFPSGITNYDTKVIPSTQSFGTECSQYSSEDEKGLVMTIDVETDSPRSNTVRNFSDASTRPLVSSNITSYNTDNIYDTIEVEESVFNEHDMGTSAHGYSTPYSKRKKKGLRHRYVNLNNGPYIKSVDSIIKVSYNFVSD